MKIENTYPNHTTEEEWSELAVLASKILSTMAASLHEREASITIAV